MVIDGANSNIDLSCLVVSSHLELAEMSNYDQFAAEINQQLLFQESLATYDEQGYVGFGFDGWQSGVQSFPDVNQFTTNYLPRSFPTGKLEKLLTSSLHGLEHAISVEKKN